MTVARRLLRRDGPVIPGRFGDLRSHPAATAERRARGGFVDALVRLNIDLKVIEKPPVANRHVAEKKKAATAENVVLLDRFISKGRK